MKFTLDSAVEFEADNMDQALIKLSLHFMSLMQSPPLLLINDAPPLDMVKIIKSSISSLNNETTDGFINVDFIVDHQQPRMMQ